MSQVPARLNSSSDPSKTKSSADMEYRNSVPGRLPTCSSISETEQSAMNMLGLTPADLGGISLVGSEIDVVRVYYEGSAMSTMKQNSKKGLLCSISSPGAPVVLTMRDLFRPASKTLITLIKL